MVDLLTLQRIPVASEQQSLSFQEGPWDPAARRHGLALQTRLQPGHLETCARLYLWCNPRAAETPARQQRWRRHHLRRTWWSDRKHVKRRRGGLTSKACDGVHITETQTGVLVLISITTVDVLPRLKESFSGLQRGFPECLCPHSEWRLPPTHDSSPSVGQTHRHWGVLVRRVVGTHLIHTFRASEYVDGFI